MEKKKQKPLLTQELMTKLGEDGYCFNLDHEKEIAFLKSEIDRMKEEHSSLIAKLEQQHKEDSLKSKETIMDLEDEVERLKDSNSTFGWMVSDLETKLNSSEDNAVRKLRKENKCFDAQHLPIAGMIGFPVAAPELTLFGVLVSTESVPPDSRFAVFMPKENERLFMALKRAIDERKARALGSMIQNKPKDVPPGFGGGLF